MKLLPLTIALIPLLGGCATPAYQTAPAPMGQSQIINMAVEKTPTKKEICGEIANLGIAAYSLARTAPDVPVAKAIAESTRGIADGSTTGNYLAAFMTVMVKMAYQGKFSSVDMAQVIGYGVCLETIPL